MCIYCLLLHRSSGDNHNPSTAAVIAVVVIAACWRGEETVSTWYLTSEVVGVGVWVWWAVSSERSYSELWSSNVDAADGEGSILALVVPGFRLSEGNCQE